MKNFTWDAAKKFYVAAIGALASLLTVWADAPTWLVGLMPVLTAAAVWLTPPNNEPT